MEETLSSISPNGVARDEQPLFDTVVETVQTKFHGVYVNNDRKVIKFAGASDVCYFNMQIDVKEEERLVIAYVFCPLKAPEEKRSVVAEYLTMANYGIKVGNFEFDYNDGETRYKGCIDLAADGVLTEKMFHSVLARCLATVTRYFPGIAKIIYSGIEAKEAIEIAEPSRAAARSVVEALAAALNTRRSRDEEGSDEPVTEPVPSASSELERSSKRRRKNPPS